MDTAKRRQLYGTPDVIVNPYRYAAGGAGPILDTFAHVWDCTAVSGTTLPDTKGSQNMTLSGSYTSDTTGLTPTAITAMGAVATSGLSVDLNNGDYTLIAVFYAAAMGTGNRRVWCGHDDSPNMEWRNDVSDTSLFIFPNNVGTLDSTATDVVMGCAMTFVDASQTTTCWLYQGDTKIGSASDTSTDKQMGATFRLMNRDTSDRAYTSWRFIGCGIIGSVLSEADIETAIAELTAL